MAGFRKAKAEQAALKIGMYGPAGSGKTFTSLLLAEGLAKLDGKRVAFVDTERGTDFYCKDVKERKIHPAAFDFDALYTKSLTEIISAVKSLKFAEHGVVIIDSITHVWEAARLAYDGRTTSAGTIPFHAWGKIKKPYKELVNMLLSSPMHVILCGRQGIEYEEDEKTEELKAVGKRMKAEGETPYEPHILLRMEPKKEQHGNCTYRVFVEKDRTGVLAGQTFTNPSFDNLCKPLLHLLGKEQATIPSDDEVSTQDASALAEEERKREAYSREQTDEFEARFKLAKTQKQLDEVSKQLTPEVKKRMLPNHVSHLRESYQRRSEELSGRGDFSLQSA